MKCGIIACVLVGTVTLLSGCGDAGHHGRGHTEAEAVNDPAALAEGKRFVLEQEPADARGVIEVRAQAQDGDEVVVVGRVGGSTKPFTPGRATFLIVDPSLSPSTRCSIPWDYCEVPEEDLAAARAAVRFVDGQGKTLAAGAREMFGIKELTTVVVTGQARRDENGNLTVIGRGIHVRKEPE
jgi:hypothetical protein